MSYKRMQSNDAQQALLDLLAIKDSDMRLDVVLQGMLAIDHSVHIGGSFSELIPLVTMVYGGFIDWNVENPTALENDVFVLSKGHGIAGMASIFSDCGYFDRSIFQDARCYASHLNGHPGPILPGVQIATGPLGQGVSTAVGFAQAQQSAEFGCTFCLVGDGEVQEGIPWEAFMYAGEKRLNNFCLIVDYNRGQNDDNEKLLLTLGDLKAKLEAFGFEVADVDGTKYSQMYAAFARFADRSSEKPFAILSNCKKGEGGFGFITESHKTEIPDDAAKQETALQLCRRTQRVENFCRHYEKVRRSSEEEARQLREAAAQMNLSVEIENGSARNVSRVLSQVKLKPAAPRRQKNLLYNAALLPKLEVGKDYKADHVISDAVAVFAQDPRMVTIDADLGNITGLQIGMRRTNQRSAYNTGIAESNMMGMAEAFAVRGCNVWCGTFGMFLDWRVLRRIAVSQQERMEVIEAGNDWLSEGHALDITFLASAANLDTQVNGATHMSIDDANALCAVPHLKIIDVACPRMLLSAMQWIAEGGKGLVLLRATRAKTRVIYDDTLQFTYGKGYVHGDLAASSAAIITSGRGIYEALSARALLAGRGVTVAAVDMPSFDEELLMRLTQSGMRLVFAEQNNGILMDAYLSALVKNKVAYNPENVAALSTMAAGREKRFLHSGTYAELLEVCGLTPEAIAQNCI